MTRLPLQGFTAAVARHTYLEIVSGIAEQLLPMIGVVVGATASYVAGALSERARWRREQSARLDELRIEAYAAYGQAVKAVFAVAGRVAGARGLNTTMHPLIPEVGLAELDRLATEREVKWEHVLLIGDVTVVAAARQWHQTIWQLEWFARAKAAEMTPAAWERAVVDSGHARQRFYAAARDSLASPERCQTRYGHRRGWLPHPQSPTPSTAHL